MDTISKIRELRSKLNILENTPYYTEKQRSDIKLEMNLINSQLFDLERLQCLRDNRS